jgi:hypothetical protein
LDLVMMMLTPDLALFDTQTYLSEKVKVGCVCLFCNGHGKAFRTATDVQRHMGEPPDPW